MVRIPSIEPLLRMIMDEIDRRSPGYLQMLDLLMAKIIVDTGAPLFRSAWRRKWRAAASVGGRGVGADGRAVSAG